MHMPRLTPEPATSPEIAVDLMSRVRESLACWDRSEATKTFRNDLLRLPGAKDDARRVTEEILMGVDAIGQSRQGVVGLDGPDADGGAFSWPWTASAPSHTAQSSFHLGPEQQLGTEEEGVGWSRPRRTLCCIAKFWGIGSDDRMPVESIQPASKTLLLSDVGFSAYSRIGANISIVGEVITSGDLQVDGKIHGSIECLGSLVISAGAQVKGTIVSNSAMIKGNVIANIEVKDRIGILSGAELVGDLTCVRLSIEDGADFRGRIDIRTAHLALQGSLEADELDRIAESDIADGRFVTSEDDDSLKKRFLRLQLLRGLLSRSLTPRS
jgi:cytoskeletal protein CcmA (bactofilin family)